MLENILLVRCNDIKYLEEIKRHLDVKILLNFEIHGNELYCIDKFAEYNKDDTQTTYDQLHMHESLNVVISDIHEKNPTFKHHKALIFDIFGPIDEPDKIRYRLTKVFPTNEPVKHLFTVDEVTYKK